MIFSFAFSFVTCVICYGSFHLLMWYVKRRPLYELSSKLEGPQGLPILGIVPQIFGDGEHILNRLKEWDELYPSPYRYWGGPTLTIKINDPVHLKEAWLNPATLGKGDVLLSVVRPLLGEGLLMAPLEKWRPHRKIIQPMFNRNISESYCEIFSAKSKIFTEIIERNVDGTEFKVFELLSACFLDMVCESVFGVNINVQTDKNCRFSEALQQVMMSLNERLFKFWLRPDFIFYRTKLGRNTQRNLKYIHEFARNIIEIKRKESRNRRSYEATAVDDEDDASNRTSKIKGTLDHLLSSEDGSSQWSDKELQDEVNTLIVAGHDTSAIVTDFTILMLASHPDVQDKVYEELYEIYGDADIDDRPVKTEDLVHMKYMERVIKETMRLFPVGPVIGRQLTGDVNVGEHTYPRGTYLMIGIHSIHRQEEYWPDPLKFDPDRFLPEECAKRHPYAYLPFSAGPRNCIGYTFAMMSMKILLATVLRRYILKKDNPSPMKDIRLSIHILIKPVEPITVRIERRTRN